MTRRKWLVEILRSIKGTWLPIKCREETKKVELRVVIRILAWMLVLFTKLGRRVSLEDR